MAAICPVCQLSTKKNHLIQDTRCPRIYCPSNAALVKKLNTCSPSDFPRVLKEVEATLQGSILDNPAMCGKV